MAGPNAESPQRRRPSRGQTLLELVGATTIIATALVPALALIRGSLQVGRATEMANLMSTLSVSKLEEHLLITAGGWNPATVNGDFAADGYPNLRFQVVRSDAAGDGGLPNSLMAITSTVWEDLDADATLDAGEPRVFFASKQSRNVAYQREANGT